MNAYPVHDWAALAPQARARLLARPAALHRAELSAQVRAIIAGVRERGDAATREYTELFDGVRLEALAVPADDIAAAAAALRPQERAALERAIDNVRRFHAAQRLAPLIVETSPGVVCERREVPLRAVGLYVPAGSAPLPSAAIMLAVPAALAGVATRVLCTPPGRDGRVAPAVLYVAAALGIERVFRIGGAQAIAAMAFGTESVPKVDKVFGPGNAWVTEAKLQVARDPAGAAFDLPAGPSEVMVIADAGARAPFLAADLLAQLEHDASSQALLVTTAPALAAEVAREIERQSAALSRSAIIDQSLAHLRLITVPDLATAVSVANTYAPEHLLLQVSEPRALLGAVHSAGSVFLGTWTPEPLGDYCTGTNHVLPTYGYARAYSGLSLADFARRMTVQEVSPAGLRDLGPVACTLAGLEGLDAHARAVTLRLEALARDDASAAGAA